MAYAGFSGNSGFARLRPWQARAVLFAAGAMALFCVAITFSPLARTNIDKHRPGQGDIALYHAEIDRIRAGEGYYQAAATELRARGYPTLSMFNWRWPLPMWLIGKLPADVLGKAMLCGLSLLLLGLAFEALAREQQRETAIPGWQDSRRPPVPRRAVLCTLLLTGPLLFGVLGDLFVMPVLWAGVLIGLSLAAFGIGRPDWGVTCGIAAAFVRELALPYCLLAAVLAAWRRQWRELLAWSFGLAAWLGFFLYHWHTVGQLLRPGDHAHPEGWIQFGGAGFVISTVQMSAYLLLLPQWVAAVAFVAAMLGLAGWRGQLAERVTLTATAYTVAFAVVGQEFNQYWGSLTAPLWCFGLAAFPAAFGDLWRAAALWPAQAHRSLAARQ